ncbi:hypothetical protein ERO13_A01G025500v2 [Gossypium hirsutum]|uniref:Uncharacterized protein n=1 Tax=Gossypium tomentosum TaxID=34277 RepID=A0A5D2RL46_GOSTO|nr:hypothetical protein ERO13_A01G025500v2 [Gossypium hirsutum]TYI41567.1 hypothetical protein ES332_A01G035100v1 [Gossypium tomentosum]
MAVTAVYGGRAQPSFILQVSDAWKAGGWCPRRWWWCA